MANGRAESSPVTEGVNAVAPTARIPRDTPETHAAVQASEGRSWTTATSRRHRVRHASLLSRTNHTSRVGRPTATDTSGTGMHRHRMTAARIRQLLEPAQPRRWITTREQELHRARPPRYTLRLHVAPRTSTAAPHGSPRWRRNRARWHRTGTGWHRSRTDRLQPGHPTDPLGQVLPVSRPRRAQSQEQATTRPPILSVHPAWRPRAGDRRGETRRQRTRPADHAQGRLEAHAAPQVAEEAR